MTVPDTSGWTAVEPPSDCPEKVFEIEPSIYAVFPPEGFVQNESQALSLLSFFQELAEKAGRPLALVVFLDTMDSQDPEARAVWRGLESSVVHCSALVCTSFFARVLGGFILAMIRPKMPTKMTGSFERALAWIHKQSEDGPADIETATDD